MGNGSTRAAKSIPTQHQGKRGLSGRAGGAWRGAQDAVIFGMFSGKPQTNAGHRRQTRDTADRRETDLSELSYRAQQSADSESGAVTEVGVAWNGRPMGGLKGGASGRGRSLGRERRGVAPAQV